MGDAEGESVDQLFPKSHTLPEDAEIFLCFFAKGQVFFLFFLYSPTAVPVFELDEPNNILES